MSARFAIVGVHVNDIGEAAGVMTRVQLSRRKGWQLPANTISVARPTKWGNPYRVQRAGQGIPEKYAVADRMAWVVVRGDKWGNPQNRYGGFTSKEDATAFAVGMFERSVLGSRLEVDGEHTVRSWLAALAGKNLACWCPLPEPGQPDWCHAAVLLRLTNETQP